MNANYIKKASADELIEKLSKHEIVLDKAIILKQYANCFHLYQLLESMQLRYEKQIKALNNLNKSVNSDYLEAILDKLVQANYDISQSTDPYYLLKDLNCLTEKTSIDRNEISQFINRLLRMNELYHLNRIGGYFKMYDEECERKVHDLFEAYQTLYLTKKETKEFVQLITNYITSFSRDQELNSTLELIRIGAIAALGKTEDIDKAIHEIKTNYQLSIFNIYSYVLLGTLDADSNKLFSHYYQKVKQYMVLTDEDKEERAFIDRLYEDVMMEECKES